MDALEKKIKALFEAKKIHDDKSIPDFEWYRIKLARFNFQKRLYAIARVAALFALIVGSSMYVWVEFDSTTRDKSTTIDFDRAFPTEVLIQGALDNQYIWEWKSPTDGLLKRGHDIMNTRII